MRTILVTGADGFSGSALVTHLTQQGYSVVAGVRNRARKLALEQRFVKALVCDVSDAINVARVVASTRPDGVIHLAGVSHAVDAAEEPLAAYQSIVTGWANVLDAVRRSSPRAKVLLISAADVYGAPAEPTEPIKETAPLQPTSTFGALKATAESIARTFHKNYHLDITIARPFMLVGPRQPDSFYFSAAARSIAERTPDAPPLALPDLCCERDVLAIGDAAEAYEALLLNGRPNEAYNVCSRQRHSCRTLVGYMLKAAGVEDELVEIETPADDARVAVLWGDNRKVCEDTGWQPSRNVEQALTELLRYQQSKVSSSS